MATNTKSKSITTGATRTVQRRAAALAHPDARTGRQDARDFSSGDATLTAFLKHPEVRALLGEQLGAWLRRRLSSRPPTSLRDEGPRGWVVVLGGEPRITLKPVKAALEWGDPTQFKRFARSLAVRAPYSTDKVLAALKILLLDWEALWAGADLNALAAYGREIDPLDWVAELGA